MDLKKTTSSPDDALGMVRTTCRVCMNHCAIRVKVEDQRVVEVRGDPDDPMFGGFSCIKGRSQAEYLYSPDRITRPLKRIDGEFRAISMDRALDEIAERLSAIRREHGARAIASWAGTMQQATKSSALPLLIALMEAIGSPFRFDPNTIDQGGKQMAAFLHGQWGAPSYGFTDPDAIMLIGTNSVLSMQGLPASNPGTWLKRAMRKGTQLVVIDPRRSDVAERATLHLQPRPGYDADILAAIIRTIIREGLTDADFVAQNVRGLDEIVAALDPFVPERVAAAADLDPGDIIAAARIYGTARRGYTMTGTGANMSGPGTLIEYLVLVLNSIRGHWMRAGDIVEALPVLIPLREYRAQATSPADGPWAMGETFVRGLSQTAAGHPASAMIDHMLLEDERRLRAVISYGGNPVLAMPDYAKADKAFRALDLLVQIDPWMSATSALADYVLPPLLPFETASSTVQLDLLSGRATGFGMALAYSCCSDPLVPPPPGSDMLEEWQMFVGIGERMGLALTPRRFDGLSFEITSAMTSGQLRETMHRGSRVPFERVLAAGGGALYPDNSVRVLPKQPGWEGRFDVAAKPMVEELASRAGALEQRAETNAFPLRLISRRVRHVHNSFCNLLSTNRGKPYNPAYVHPHDLLDLGLSDGDPAVLRSAHGQIEAVVEADPSLRRGIVSMAHCYGGTGVSYRQGGSNVNALIANDDVFDRFTGQPRMSNVPIRLEPLPAAMSADPWTD